MVSKKSRTEVRENKHRKLRNRFSGTAERPRLAVFRSNNHMYAQIIDDTVGKTLVSASTLQKEVKAEIEKYNVEIKKYILNNLYDDNKKVLKRNTLDENSDISILGIVTPFEIFSPSEKKVQNTVNKIEMTLRTFSRRLLKI